MRALCRHALPLLLAVVGSSAAAQSAPNGRPLLVALEFKGVKSIDKDALANGLVTRATECKNLLYTPVCWVTRSPTFSIRRYLDEAELRRDVLRIRLLYWRRGYRDVAVTTRTDRVRGGLRVTFDVREDAPTVVESLEIRQVDSVLSTRVINGAVPLRADDPLDLIALDSGVTQLRDVLWRRGYADSRIAIDTSRVSNERNAGPIALTIDPGKRTTVKSIEITGNTSVEEQTIRRLLRFRENGLYRRDQVLESQRDLYLSGLFAEVDIEAEVTSDSAKRVSLFVIEAPKQRVELTAGFTTYDFLQADAQYTRFNWLGNARRLTLRATASNLLAKQLNDAGPFYDVTADADPELRSIYTRPTWAASVDFTQPWFLSSRTQLGASIFTHRRSVPSIVTDRGGGGTVALTRTFGLRRSATLGYTYESSTIEANDVYFCVSVGLCVPSAIRVIAERHPLSPISLVGQWDGTDKPLSPSRGVRASVDLEHASRLTLSDFEYNRASASVSGYRRTLRSGVLAGRLKLGWVNALSGTNRRLGVREVTEDLVVHPRKQFFSGGSQSVRGYGENQLGPRVLTVDPAVLTDTVLASPCTEAQLLDGSCDPNLAGVGAGSFQPRPLGGSSLAEASIEYRFPISVAAGFTGAVFLDAAIVGTQRFSDLLGATATVSPGFGVRFDTPAGPVRLDLGIRPRVVERLPVITQVTGPDGSFQLVTLNTRRRFSQAEATGGTLGQVLSRLTLHLAIGPAF